MKIIPENNKNLENNTYLTDQVRWGLLKYGTCKFVINLSRKLERNSRKSQTYLETKTKNLKQNICDEDKFNEFKTVNNWSQNSK